MRALWDACYLLVNQHEPLQFDSLSGGSSSRVTKDACHAREVVFTVHGTQLEVVSDFPYLGHPFLSMEDDWPAVYQNLSKAHKQWGRIACMLSWTGASLRTSSMFYKAVVQSVLLYGSKTWTLSSTMLKVLGGFHN